MRKLIKNGLIYDGSGDEPYQKHILIEDNKIIEITENEVSDVDAVIDASNMVVTPGFIDTHRHMDIPALYDEDFGKLELAQGLTTVIGGNCGLGIVPTTNMSRKQVYDFVEPCLGIAPADMKMTSMKQYLDELDMVNSIRVGSYIGTGAVKAAVKGFSMTPFTAEEMELSKAYIKEALDAGAVGLSMGLMYQPECYSSREEIVELLSAATPFGRPLTCHIRGEGDNLISSVREIIRLADRAGLPLNISHFKCTGIKNWNKVIYEAIEEIEKARSKGQNVTADFYPYCGGSTTLISLIPPVIMEEDMTKLFLKLSRAEGKKKLKEQIMLEHVGWDNMITAIGWERIVISSVTKEANKQFTGLNFKQAARAAGYEDVADFFCEILIDELGKVGIIVLSMSQEDVDTVARLPYSMVISDALYGVSDCPHPRLYGSFPKIIREYVLERGVLTMEQAIHKMTGKPARYLNLTNSGLLKENYIADINIFAPDKIRDYATFEDSKRISGGVAYTLIDGNIIMKDSRMCGNYKVKAVRV